MIVIVAALGIIITAAYVLRVVGRCSSTLQPQAMPGGGRHHRARALHPAFLLGVPLILLGVYPALMAPMLGRACDPCWRC
ncbi:MAG: hypothetical protein U0703_11110 [Anaerolineae bacterium]